MKRPLLVVVGAIVGLMVVRAFMLDPIEEMGWSIFWEGFFKGQLNSQDMGMAFQSATFMKSLIGMLVGGFLGFMVAKMPGTTQAQG